jgi:hypothetical protein
MVAVFLLLGGVDVMYSNKPRFVAREYRNSFRLKAA